MGGGQQWFQVCGWEFAVEALRLVGGWGFGAGGLGFVIQTCHEAPGSTMTSTPPVWAHKERMIASRDDDRSTSLVAVGGWGLGG